MKNKETLEEVAERLQKDKYGIFISKDADVKGQLVINTARAAFLSGMKEGAKWQTERMYSEEEVVELFKQYKEYFGIYRNMQISNAEFNKWFEQFKRK